MMVYTFLSLAVASPSVSSRSAESASVEFPRMAPTTAGPAAPASTPALSKRPRQKYTVSRSDASSESSGPHARSGTLATVSLRYSRMLKTPYHAAACAPESDDGGEKSTTKKSAYSQPALAM